MPPPPRPSVSQPEAHRCRGGARPPAVWDLAGTSLGLPVDRVTMQKEALGRGAWRACCVHR